MHACTESLWLFLIFFFLHPLCLPALVSHFEFPSSVFPRTPFVGLTMTYFVSCIEFMVLCLCVSILFCFYIPPPPFGSVTCPEPASLLKNPVTFLWFLCSCDSWFFFQSYAAFLSRGVQMRNYSKKKNCIKCIQPVFLSSCL